MKRMAEEFSIIIPVYNRAKLLTRCLDSVRAQTYRPLHLIIVDNASTDNSFQVAAEWSNRNVADDLRITLLSEPAHGACNARNRGLQAVTSRYMMFFDSDDAMRPQLVERAISSFRAYPDTDMVCWKTLDHRNDGTRRVLKWTRSRFMVTHLIHSVLYTAAYAVRRSFFNHSGTWDTALAVWNDWELGVRLLLKEPHIRFVPEILVDKYEQSVSITGENFYSKSGQWEESMSRVKRRLADSNHPDKERLSRLVDYRRMILAAHYSREGHRHLASELIATAMSDFKGSSLQRMLLRAAYLYTRTGMRGAALWVVPFM